MSTKQSYRILITILIVLTFSCQKFLEEEPSVFASPDQILVDAAGAELYTVGNYD